MKKLILLAGCAALAACSQEEAAPVENIDTNVATAETAAPVPAAFQLTETSWTFTRDG